MEISLSNFQVDSTDNAVPLWEIAIDNYRYVLFSQNKALVYKGDKLEPSYEISSLGCSCPADRYRSDMCKHRKLISYVGDGSSGKLTPQEPEASTKEKSTSSIGFEGGFIS